MPMETLCSPPAVSDADPYHARMMLVDEFLPTFDVSDTVATLVSADIATTWRALMEVDLIDVGRNRPMVAFLGGLRVLPDLVAHSLHGETAPHRPDRLRLRDTTELSLGDGAWVLLGERPADEIALGLVGKFWRPVIKFAKVRANGFREFAEPGYAKTIYSLSVRAVSGDRALLSGTMRTATTDEEARRWFRRYWTFGVGSGAHVLVQAVIEAAREAAERQIAEHR
jgi:hypothetical protein